MYVDEVIVDYNDSHKMMRIKSDEGAISPECDGVFAKYFYSK